MWWLSSKEQCCKAPLQTHGSIRRTITRKTSQPQFLLRSQPRMKLLPFPAEQPSKKTRKAFPAEQPSKKTRKACNSIDSKCVRVEMELYTFCCTLAPFPGGTCVSSPPPSPRRLRSPAFRPSSTKCRCTPDLPSRVGRVVEETTTKKRRTRLYIYIYIYISRGNETNSGRTHGPRRQANARTHTHTQPRGLYCGPFGSFHPLDAGRLDMVLFSPTKTKRLYSSCGRMNMAV